MEAEISFKELEIEEAHRQKLNNLSLAAEDTTIKLIDGYSTSIRNVRLAIDKDVFD